MTDLLPIDLRDMLACVDRELRLRCNVYPHWVDSGKLSQSRADREIEMMAALRAYLADQITKGKSP